MKKFLWFVAVLLFLCAGQWSMHQVQVVAQTDGHVTISDHVTASTTRTLMQYVVKGTCVQVTAPCAGAAYSWAVKSDTGKPSNSVTIVGTGPTVNVCVPGGFSGVFVVEVQVTNADGTVACVGTAGFRAAGKGIDPLAEHGGTGTQVTTN
jgi:hypothetical protein